jgi:hypothetical protein
MNEPFEPRNDLEQRLLEAQEGKIQGEVFMQELLVSQVFVPVKDDTTPGGIQRSTKATLLTLEADDGSRVVAVFTSPERARPVVQTYPGFGGGILEDFKWLLEKVGTGVGIALNPGWEVGLDMEAGTVEQLKQG